MGTQEREGSLGFVWRLEMGRELDASLPQPELPDGYIFAPLDVADLHELAGLEVAAFADTPDARAFAQQLASQEVAVDVWLRLARNPHFKAGDSVVVRCGGRLVGFAQCSRSGRIGYVNSVAVLPEHRGGTGRALMLEAMRLLRRRGAREVALTVTAENSRAVRLYERLGFEERGWSISIFRR